MSQNSQNNQIAEFKGLVMGVLADGILVISEVEMLRQWLENHLDLTHREPFSQIYQTSLKIKDEQDTEIISSLKIFLEQFLGFAAKPNQDVKSRFGIILDQPCMLERGSICLCGTIQKMPLESFSSLAKESGFDLSKMVNLGTKALIIAEIDGSWKESEWARVIERGISYREMGSGIKIMDLDGFIHSLKK